MCTSLDVVPAYSALVSSVCSWGLTCADDYVKALASLPLPYPLILLDNSQTGGIGPQTNETNANRSFLRIGVNGKMAIKRKVATLKLTCHIVALFKKNSTKCKQKY